MPNKIVLTDPAQADLEDIFTYYAPLIGERKAHDLILSLLSQLDPLLAQPGLGRPSQSPGVRELVFLQPPYVAPYRVVGNAVQVLRFLHQRQERPEYW
ncbi:type II toxin-antitoxin system RelE/ParE family toxin [Halopseudomonas pelagia]|uniref:Plasmid stabilization protein ParE n=1 Tax=Halopseudomonas pelagia TaxID=553151 RepID=A0AA91U1E6_9GAMM|nr:type II toxin-antitoxin system RelE/ParE family toxin [Halopseudomonas pelagia]PCC98993.1 plasmid stabilization protein ParE [Halopseudomonas pelagia]QFY55414.1 type II toxin-antitoxin system RelE/ParE family toxin [Halopseudomonas pelagia]